jgi:LytS/YehU family sensor histidine kinase
MQPALNSGSDIERPFTGWSPKWWALTFLAWSIPAVIAMLQATAGYALRGVLGKEWIWVVLQYPRWMTWALVTPLIFWAANRIPLRRERLAASVATHVLLALVCAAVIEFFWLQINIGVQEYIEPGSMAAATRTEIFVGGWLSRLVGGAFTYAAALGVATALGYHRRFREREVRASQLEAQLALAQVQALKMQLHPHFLFNTLHAITVLIREDPAAATRAVTRLGDLLRLTLSSAKTAEVSFRRELEILSLYLDIERTRFQDRLVINYDVQPATLDALVPDLILQPLVENAIKHGVSPHAATGRIDVRSRADGEWLILEIHDSGAGIPAGASPPDGIGLSTTAERLRRLYGERHELSLGNAPEGGFRARIRIPFRLAGDQPSNAPPNRALLSEPAVSVSSV